MAKSKDTKSKKKDSKRETRIAGARPFWRGNLKLSLVSCPIFMFPATESGAHLSFNLINPDTNNRIHLVPHDAETGEELDRSELVKGYQYEKGKYVLMEDEDFEKARIESTHTISLESFVPQSDVDCFYTDTPYYLVPNGKEAIESYRVIHEAMKAEKSIGIGYVVIGQRERLVGVAPKSKGFVLNTLRTKGELRQAEDFFTDIPSGKADKEMVDIAEQLIKKRSNHFTPGKYTDHYEEALLKIIQAKIKGQEPVEIAEPSEGKVVNLMDALKKSLQAEEAGKRNPKRKKAG